MEEKEKREKLIGKSNYLGWYKIITARLRQKGFVIKNVLNNSISYPEEKHDEAYFEIISYLSNQVAGTVPETENPQELMKHLEDTFGVGNKFELKRTYLNFKLIGSLDPNIFFEKLLIQQNKIIVAGGKVSHDESFMVITNGIHQVFYGDFIRNVREKYGDQEMTEKTRSVEHF
jgi:hypothetical protein